MRHHHFLSAQSKSRAITAQSHIFNKSLFLMLGLIGVVLFFYGCTPEPSPNKKNRPITPKERAEQLIIEAWSYESKVTSTLKEIGGEKGATLKGLEHRLKTHSSTVRKVKKVLTQDPKLTVNNVHISDALRYTFEIKDEPPGHYVKSIQDILKRLEREGYPVIQVKNYWKKGDNYSGVNIVLGTSSSFKWELQIHTPASLSESKRSHILYERLRRPDTPLAERQSIFDEMKTPWETIPVPQDVLVEKNLHSVEVIKALSRPQ